MIGTVAYSSDTEAAGVFGRTLARHMQAVMTGTGMPFSAVTIEERTSLPEEEDLLLGMSINAESPGRTWCVDLGAALSLQPMRKSVVLGALPEQMTGLCGATPSPAAILAMASGLQKARPLVAIDQITADTLSVFGCENVTTLAAPALPPFVMAPDPERTTVLVFDHIGSPIALGLLKDAIGKVSEDVTLCFIDELMPEPLRPFFSCVPYFSEWPLRAGLHIHLGTPRSDRLGTRIVDSQACNRPVVSYLPVSHPDLRSPIVHERDGLVCTDAVELTAAVNTLLSDPFFGELLAKNARRSVAAFNQAHLDALRTLLKDAHAA